jgi:hypothetical protein
MKFAPQFWLVLQREERQINNESRKIVEGRIKIIYSPFWMLVVAMAQLGRFPANHRWDKHAVKVYQAQRITIVYDNIAVLEITMRHFAIPK